MTLLFQFKPCIYSPFDGVRVYRGRGDRRRRFRFLLFPGRHGRRRLDGHAAVDHVQLDDQPGLLQAPHAIVAAQLVHRPAVDPDDLVAGAQRAPGRLGAGRRAAVGAWLHEQPVARIHAVESQPEAQPFAGQTVHEHLFGGGGVHVHRGHAVLADGQHGDERIFQRLLLLLLLHLLDASRVAAAAVHRNDGDEVFNGHGCTHGASWCRRFIVFSLLL